MHDHISTPSYLHHPHHHHHHHTITPYTITPSHFAPSTITLSQYTITPSHHTTIPSHHHHITPALYHTITRLSHHHTIAVWLIPNSSLLHMHTHTHALTHPIYPHHTHHTYPHTHTHTHTHSHTHAHTLTHTHTCTQFKRHIGVYYKLFCNLLTLELKFEIRSLLRRVFIRIGQEFSIASDLLVPSWEPRGIITQKYLYVISTTHRADIVISEQCFINSVSCM